MAGNKFNCDFFFVHKRGSPEVYGFEAVENSGQISALGIAQREAALVQKSRPSAPAQNRLRIPIEIGHHHGRRRPPLGSLRRPHRRILHFAPSKAAASTSALLRRFRSLWRASAAVNLEIRVPDRLLDLPRNDRIARILSLRDGFASGARSALDAAADEEGEDPVTRLTFNLDADSSILANDFLYRDGAGRWSLQEIDVVGGLLSRPAARRVEELRVAVTHYGIAARLVEEPGSSSDIGLCSLGLGALPSETLRVLDLTNCELIRMPMPMPAGGVAFPRLASLRLLHCVVPLGHLQELVDAAPGLAVVHLEFVLLAAETQRKNGEGQEEEEVLRLRCPAATAPVLDQCGWTLRGSGVAVAVEIDAPRLRRFRYRDSCGGSRFARRRRTWHGPTCASPLKAHASIIGAAMIHSGLGTACSSGNSFPTWSASRSSSWRCTASRTSPSTSHRRPPSACARH
ncbi:uncharacterized protein LOC100841469 [Brachypodium distachyon]|uniref:uncharacterized protein LOC100841469 n=1 Tax=Brachypodium distachyon TaxID=15368 RepID=UPI000D0E1303|nr:uncharacterized protein LOC100841469 [Brachypodium distachyon]|eukprot:XP_024310304.1 uncharacterized protein LOC100841469 [Brachypodium distachyon]